MFTERARSGDESWCSVCNGCFRAARQTVSAEGAILVEDVPAMMPTLASSARAAPRQLHPVPTSVWCCRVETDGSITLSVGGCPRVPITMEQARDFADAMIWLGRGAQGRQEQIRGADRWAFSRVGDGYRVRYLDEEHPLRRYTVGKTKYRPPACEACGHELAAGTPAYQPVGALLAGSRIRWAEVRLCPGCVEAAPDAAAPRAPLKLILGEKSPRRAAR